MWSAGSTDVSRTYGALSLQENSKLYSPRPSAMALLHLLLRLMSAWM